MTLATPLSSSSSPVTTPAKFDGKTKHLDKYKSIHVMEITKGKRFIEPTDERIATMMESLSKDGQLNPIIVYNVYSNQYKLIAAATRLLAARKLGWKFIQCRVSLTEQTEVDCEIAELAENEFRADYSADERARMRARLKELRGAAAGFPGEVVLDPFCGSGTTCTIARQLGRQYIGVDVNPDYVKLARENVAGAPAEPPVLLVGAARYLGKDELSKLAAERAGNSGKAAEAQHKRVTYGRGADAQLTTDAVD